MSTEPSPADTNEIRFLRAFWAALFDEKTYDVARNPPLWLGFLLGIPIPVLTFAAGADNWLKLMTLPAPFFWALILGAAGRVGLRAQQESERLEGEVREAHETLGEEVVKRRALEDEAEGLISELKLAQAIQRTLLPASIQRPDCEAVARCIPTRYIGGDYVHSNVVQDRWLYLVVLDVSGHGISAAMVVARLHGMVRRLTLTRQRPVQMLQRLNTAANSLLRHTYFFLTAVVARIDLVNGELDYATAGHPAQLLLRQNGGVETLRTRNRLLGMDDDVIARDEPSKRVILQPGDSVVFFTDGLFEVLKDGEGEILGEEGLQARIAGLGQLTPQLLIGEVLQDLAEYQGSSEFEDDVTLLVARYLGRDGQGPAGEGPDDAAEL
jgi:serine phosphatase RsbU (regulator of sigma subunit)